MTSAGHRPPRVPVRVSTRSAIAARMLVGIQVLLFTAAGVISLERAVHSHLHPGRVDELPGLATALWSFGASCAVVAAVTLGVLALLTAPRRATGPRHAAFIALAIVEIAITVLTGLGIAFVNVYDAAVIGPLVEMALALLTAVLAFRGAPAALRAPTRAH